MDGDTEAGWELHPALLMHTQVAFSWHLCSVHPGCVSWGQSLGFLDSPHQWGQFAAVDSQKLESEVIFLQGTLFPQLESQGLQPAWSGAEAAVGIPTPVLLGGCCC